ncbi:MAG: 50S ribosomal protein L30 [bacterium]
MQPAKLKQGKRKPVKLDGKIKVTLLRSKNHRDDDTLATLETLGLKKINSFKVLPGNAAVRGAVAKLAHMVAVEEIA